MGTKPYRNISTRNTPQNQPIEGTVPNSAGGHAFPVDDWTRLQRFLILGSEGGSYYAGEKKLTRENADALARCITKDGPRTVQTIVDISVSGRNPKQHPVMFALAACTGAADPVTRAAALDAIPVVCRTGSHILLFAQYVEQFRGWGRGLRSAVGNWYLNHQSLDLQLAKYPQREGWSHRDLLRLAKPRPERGSEVDHALGWVTGKYEPVAGFLAGVEDARTANAKQLVALIEEHRLPWECVPSDKLNDPLVLEALLPHMPLGALVRNLNRYTIAGVFKPLSVDLAWVVDALTDETNIKRSRIHPLNVLIAQRTYAGGKGVKGKGTWHPIGDITDALEQCFYKAFQNVEAANKRTLLALDVSGSMTWSTLAGTNLMPRDASAAMALVTQATEPVTHVMAFASASYGRIGSRVGSRGHDGIMPVEITKRSTLASAIKAVSSLPAGGTDCSLPMLYALNEGLQVETFVVYTDSETWAGKTHPVQALKQYRNTMGIPAKLIVVGMVSNGFSIADPNDAGMLDVVGFDSAAPAVMADFSAGR